MSAICVRLLPWSRLVLLFTSSSVLIAWSETFEEAVRAARLRPLCYFANEKYVPSVEASTEGIDTLAYCAKLCKAEANCSAFTYWPARQQCNFADRFAQRQPTTSAAVSGISVCTGRRKELDGVCTEDVPGHRFPGLTMDMSNAAWPSGVQPASLECWPRDFSGHPRRCDLRTVLQDTDTGWPGKCWGLLKQEGITGVRQCRELCEQDSLCPGWQVGYYDTCWQGTGYDCFVRSEFTPTAAQRIQHGQVRTILDLAGWQIVGLTREFVDDTSYFQDTQDAIDACKVTCYSNIACQFWQYSPKYGCWIEDPWKQFAPGYPLTLDWAYRSTPFAADCIAGEMIQHFCHEDHAVTTEQVECEAKGREYVAPAGAWSDDKVAASSVGCQLLCQKMQQCAFFTYFERGVCRLFDASAVQSVPEEAAVSGPHKCSNPVITTTTAATTTAAALQSVVAIARTNGDGPREYMLEMKYVIQSLDFTELSEPHVEGLSRRYVDVLSRVLGIHPNTIMATSDGPMHKVTLAATSDDGLPATMLLAYAVNHPSKSHDISTYRALASREETLTALEDGTGMEVRLGNSALTGLVEVIVLSMNRFSRPLPPPQPTGWARWWPFVLLVGLLLCGVGAFAGLVDFAKEKGRDQPMTYDAGEPVGWAGNKHGDRNPLIFGPGAPDASSVSAGAGAAPGGARGPLRYAGARMKQLGGAVSRQLPGHRTGEFTV